MSPINNRILGCLFLFTLLLSACNPVSIENQINEKVVQGQVTFFSAEGNLDRGYGLKGETFFYDILEGIEFKGVSAVTEIGQIVDMEKDAVIRIGPKGWVIHPKGGEDIAQVVGVYVWDQFHSTREAYEDAVKDLEQDKKVLMILLDGFSYQQYLRALQEKRLPFLSQYYQYPLLSVYVPVTNAGFAAIITGKTPDKNGVHDRSNRILQVESLFGLTEKMQKQAALLEADIKILKTEIEPELHLDLNQNGSIDDEILESAKTFIKEDYDLLFIHFHGIDDRGHNYGPFHLETLAYIQMIDAYVKELVEIWDGSVIITSDHGMHATEEGGSHGLCNAEDMIVPYFKRE